MRQKAATIQSLVSRVAVLLFIKIGSRIPFLVEILFDFSAAHWGAPRSS